MNPIQTEQNVFVEEVTAAAGQYTRERDYWLKKLSGSPVKSHFPYDYHRDSSDRRIETLESMLSPGVCRALLKMCSGSDARLYMILTAGLIFLLNKYIYTGVEDVILGSPVCRQDRDGDFINVVLIMRYLFYREMSFKDLLMHVKQVTTEANEHQNYPYEALLYKLNIPFSEKDDFPLFDTVALLTNIHEKEYLKNIRVNLVFSFRRRDESLEGAVEYNALLYRRQTIERLGLHLDMLLGQVLFNVNLKVDDVVLLGEEEKRDLIDFCNTRAGYPWDKTIHQVFQEQVEKTPDRIAVESPIPGEPRLFLRSLTYHELNRKSNQLAWMLRRKGVGPDVIVPLMLEPSVDLLIAIKGILKAGGAYLPIDTDVPGSRVEMILDDLSFSPVLMEEGEGIMGAIHREPGQNPEFVNRPGDLAYVIFTSGSTGRPKGTMIEHRGLVNYIWWAAGQYVNQEPLDFPLYTSISFDLTVTSIFTPLITGNRVVIYHREDKAALLGKIIADNRVAVVKVTPSHLKLIREVKASPHGEIKCFIVGGEELSPDLANDIYANFAENIEIYNEYGPTETTVGCMLYAYKPGEYDLITVPIGYPAGNVQVYLLTGNQKHVPFGVAGEIYVSGDGVARGYLNRVELTSEKFLPNPFVPGTRMFRTGDLARRLPDGKIEFLGRIDRQVKIRGYRIELGEIESQLLSHPAVKEAVVVCMERGSDDKYLCAYIVGTEEWTENLSISPDPGDYLSGRLPGYMVPSYFVNLREMPLTTNGKIDRKALPAPVMQLDGKYTEARDEVEEKLVEIWSDILEIEKKSISIDASFFDLGGHSLKVILLISRIHEVFNAEMELEDVFKKRTVKELAQGIRNAPENEFTPIPPAREKDYYRLSSAQQRIFILHRMESDSKGYNVPQVIAVEGRLHREKLKEVFVKMIERHESFRTSFDIVGDEPVQKIHEHVKFDIEYHNLEPGAESAGIIDKFIRPFDLAKAPLLRVGLIELKEDYHILMTDMHHIITDGVSVEIFIKEFAAIYKRKELPPLKLQYKDFSEWQNGMLESGELKKQEEYWLDRFKGKIPVLDLPWDYPRTGDVNFAGDIIYFDLGRELSNRLKDMAANTGTTVFMVLLAVYMILLSKYSNREDVLVGVTAAGRKYAGLQDIIGLFVNILPIRIFLQNHNPFFDFLMEVKQITLDAFENQDYQFDELVKKLELERDPTKNPLCDALFDFNYMLLQASGIPEIDIPGLKMSPYLKNTGISGFDIILGANETVNGLKLNIKYRKALFKRATIEEMYRYFTNIIIDVLGNDRKKLSEIDVLDEKDRIKIQDRLMGKKSDKDVKFKF